MVLRQNQLVVFADDTHPRWLTAVAQLDYDTMAGTDKFGNMFVARLPPQVSSAIEKDPSGAKVRATQLPRALVPSERLAAQTFLDDKSFNGAAKKLEEVCQYHVGDTCHSLSRVSLQPGGTECLVYTTMLGAVGAFVPFTSREDGALQAQSRRSAAFRLVAKQS